MQSTDGNRYHLPRSLPLLLFACLACESALAEEFVCRFVDASITIDGKADDAAWQMAQVIDRFYLPWLGPDAQPARTATRARLLWDREHLYFFADMDDADLYADVTEHDGRLWDNDVFELFFKPADDKHGYYEFQVNAAGSVLDMFMPRRGGGSYERFKSDGTFHIDSAVALRGTLNQWRDQDGGWSVEGRIPWRDLIRTGGRPAVDECWKFALCRYDYSVEFEGPELSTCAPLASKSEADFHLYEDYATVRFVGPSAEYAVRPYGIARRLPLTTSRVVGSPDPPLPYRVRKAFPDLKLTLPVELRLQPDSNRLIIVTQPAAYAATSIQRIVDDPQTTEIETLLSYDQTAFDIVFHPNFAENGYLYVASNGPGTADATIKTCRVTRYNMLPSPPYTLDPNSAKVIIEWASDGHNGCAMAFGLDRMFYVTSGDGTSDSDTNVTGQDMSLLLAKLLRIDVDHPDAGWGYSVPADNPFVGKSGIRPETWAYGFRNPWRMEIDRETGHIWVGNNGQDLWEQVFFVRKGDNFGWSVMEGSHPFYLDRKPGPTPFVKPALEHPHSEARSLTGGIVYYGTRFPELRGAYVYGDYSTGKIWGARHDGTQVTWHQELADTTLQITSFASDSNGELLIADHGMVGGGGLYTLESVEPDATAGANFPRRLSETGLFASVADHRVELALIPYSVNSPLWSDGAYKERYLALPGADTQIEFTRTRGWNFPDETVLVKSFALEMEEGSPESRRWIETRLLTRQQGEWVGYSYIWNDDQTDATLVESAGLDREYLIDVPASDTHPGGTRLQTWRYPSRAECMVCHSRAANYVLGLTELQMNKEHQYGDVPDNQLRVLEALGVLRTGWFADVQAEIRKELAAEGKAEAEITTFLAENAPAPNQRQAAASSLLSLPPERYSRLVDPGDKSQALDLRARSYLHANCAQCHVEAGGGNAQMQLEFTVEPAAMKIFDVQPVHHRFNLPDARLVSPGSPESSVLLKRISHREAGHMPPLATALVDQQAVDVLREWILQLPPPTVPPTVPPTGAADAEKP